MDFWAEVYYKLGRACFANERWVNQDSIYRKTCQLF